MEERVSKSLRFCKRYIKTKIKTLCLLNLGFFFVNPAGCMKLDHTNIQICSRKSGLVIPWLFWSYINFFKCLSLSCVKSSN